MTKRFEVRLNTCYGRHLIHDGTEPMGNQTACDLLNAQAEQIEVLIEENEELKRRIAALEGM